MRHSPVVMLVLLCFLLAGGCYATTPREPVPLFFSCADCSGLPEKGTLNPADFPTRTSYPAYRHVCFVGEIDRPFGTQISWMLRAPDGSVIERGGTTHLRDDRVRGDIRIYRHTYAVRDLLDKGGAGLWQMEWFAGEEKLGAGTAQLVW